MVEANQIVCWREEWMKYFNPKSGASILELGAHNGPNLIHYGRKGHRVVGIEISDTLIDTFERFKKLESKDVQERIQMIQEWIEDYKPIEQYDYVLCTEILEHVPDPGAILRTAWREVKSEGLIYISSPTKHWGNNTHVRGVPICDLRRWIKETNLVEVSIFEKMIGLFVLLVGV